MQPTLADTDGWASTPSPSLPRSLPALARHVRPDRQRRPDHRLDCRTPTTLTVSAVAGGPGGQVPARADRRWLQRHAVNDRQPAPSIVAAADRHPGRHRHLCRSPRRQTVGSRDALSRQPEIRARARHFTMSMSIPGLNRAGYDLTTGRRPRTAPGCWCRRRSGRGSISTRASCLPNLGDSVTFDRLTIATDGTADASKFLFHHQCRRRRRDP
jgi:hypothetical protein